jgi:hypothetical protein
MRQGSFPIRHASVALTALLLILLAGVAAAEELEVFTLEGEVEPAAYDDETGDVTAVAIYDGEWGVVLVSPSGKGKELLNHVGALVTATGPITELEADSEFAYEIKVSRYTIVQPGDTAEDTESDPDLDLER